MPIITDASPYGIIASLVPAAPGWRVEASAPKGTDTSKVPTPTAVAAWVLIADEEAPGGGAVQPVFQADGRMWTPDQFRAAYGSALVLEVVPA